MSGPSGAGKGTLIERVLAEVPELELAVSATTRPPRPNETPGREYHFLSDEEFERRAQAGEFLEHVRYAHRRYGTLQDEVEDRAEEAGVVLEIEVQGARAVRAKMPEAVLVFVEPPSLNELAERLRRRGTNDDTDISERLRVAEDELRAREEFDHVIVNDDRDRAAAELAAIVREHLRAG